MTLAYRDRVRGCLLGGAVGDALGAGIEFASLAEIRSGYGPGGVRGLTPAYGVAAPLTDDTQLTLFTAGPGSGSARRDGIGAGRRRGGRWRADRGPGRVPRRRLDGGTGSGDSPLLRGRRGRRSRMRS